MEIMVHCLSELPMTPNKKKEFQVATSEDCILQKLHTMVQQGWPKSIKSVPDDLRPYWNVRDEISISDGLLFKLDKIIVPKSLQPAMLKLLHDSHMGIEKTKARARQILFWPCMAKDIEFTVNSCMSCTQS
jgi:hypothetical protein